MRRISSKQWIAIVYALLFLNCVVAGVFAWLVFGDLLADEEQQAQVVAWPTLTPTDTSTPMPTDTLTSTPTPTFTPYIVYATATFTPSPTATAAATATPSLTPTPSPTATATLSPTLSPSPTRTPTASRVPTRASAAAGGDTTGAPPLSAEAKEVQETSVTLRWTVESTATFDVLSDMGAGFGVPIFKRRVEALDALAAGSGDSTDASADESGWEYLCREEGLQPGVAYEYLILERAPTAGKKAVAPRRAWLRVTTPGQAVRPRVAWRSPLGPTPASAAQVGAPTPSPAGGLALAGPLPSGVPPAEGPQSGLLLLSLMDTTNYVDELGNVVIVGEVRNDSPHNAAAGQVVVTFYDARGEIIQQEQTSPLLSLLPARQKSPFILAVPRPPNLWDWSIRAAARPTDRYPPIGLIVTESRGREDEAGFYHVTGKVLNKSARKAHLAQIIVTLYDRDGKPINAGFAYTEPYTIEPGDTGAFDCVFTYFPRVKNHNIQIQWD